MSRRPNRPKLTVRIVEVACADYEERLGEAQQAFAKAMEDLIFNNAVDEAESARASDLAMTLDEWRRYKGTRSDPIALLWEECDKPRSNRRR